VTQRDVGNVSALVTTHRGAIQEGKVAYAPVHRQYSVCHRAFRPIPLVLSEGALLLWQKSFAPLLFPPPLSLRSTSPLLLPHPQSPQSWSWSVATPLVRIPLGPGRN
jgi:hypothetical protein